MHARTRSFVFLIFTAFLFAGAPIGAVPRVRVASALFEDPAAPRAFADLGITITPPALSGIKFDDRNAGQVHGVWQGKLDALDVQIALFVLPNAEFGFSEPTDVLALTLDNLRDPKRNGDPSFTWDAKQLVTGSFGFVPYAQIGQGKLKKETKTIGTRFVLAGLLENAGYTLEVSVAPEPGDAQKKAIFDWLKTCVASKVEPRNAKWTDAEAKERFEKFAPESAKKKFDPALRTAHYIILTNADGGKQFGEAMEACYTEIKKVFPFDDIAGQRLMPVFLFRDSEEYFQYYMKVAGITHEEAAKSKGHAWKDYYATWFDSKSDPVHIHEATHQIFANRLMLQGGGSWFQEGVAEYICTKKNDRNTTASKVKKGKGQPLAEFFAVESLLYSAQDDKSGESKAESQYTQAALFIEFLRESKLAPAKFQDFVHAIGLVPANDVPAIERVFRAVYGLDIKGLEDKWVDYCKKR
jgi:hypothetical protein